MADPLAEHLSSLAEPQLMRVATKVLGSPPQNRALTERALAQHLLDPEWIRRTLHHLGPSAEAALRALTHAGVPVLRQDVMSLVHAPGTDPVEALEDHGLITPVKTGRGMPTHIAIAPGLEGVIREQTAASVAAPEPEGLLLAGVRRRFELALMVATLAQHPPRMTREGRPHARDLNTLTELLDPLGHRSAAIEQRLARWYEIGAVMPCEGRLCLVPDVATNIPELHERIALSELASPSTPESVLRVVAALLASRGTMSIRSVLEATQTELLRDRASADESGSPRRGARRELVDVLGSLIGLEAIVLIDEEGRPLFGGGQDALQRTADGEHLAIGLDPLVAAVLREEAVPPLPSTLGHVQSSFEIVADVSCDPSLIARIGLGARVLRADRAAVLQLERAAVAHGKALGLTADSLADALARISGRPVPGNVLVVLKDWFEASPAHSPIPSPEVSLASLRTAAQDALNSLKNDELPISTEALPSPAPASNLGGSGRTSGSTLE